MYNSSLRRYCLPCVAALVSQGNNHAVKNSFLEFLAPTWNAQQYSYFSSLLGAFVQTTRLPLDGFSRNLTFKYISKICQLQSSFIKICQELTGTLREDQYIFLITSRSLLLRRRNVSHKCCRGNQNTHFVFSVFCQKSCRLWEEEKYCRTRQATDDNMVHAHCMLDN